ncbi:hypothetical protein NL676_023716 [Syzygium grande]|nr:hypothetical protein NL676_023716 [Syzygium grande]
MKSLSFKLPPIADRSLRSPKSMSSDLRSGDTKEVEYVKLPSIPRREAHVQVTHSMPPKKIEIFKCMEDWVEKNVLVHLKPIENCWQPQDFLPDAASDGMITEEALPTYQTMLNTLDGVRDETASSLTPWAIWTRAWTAEENRHGDLLNKYLYLSGRVDMKRIEKTIQYLIGAGMGPRTENSPYVFFIYTSFQERATSISHGNTSRLAKAHGDMKLAQIWGTIASDEKRHEAAYTKIMEKLFEIDPDGTVLALYTAKDYSDVLEFLVRRWKVENLTGLSAEGRRAQDYVCRLIPKIRTLEAGAWERADEALTVPFSWISDRQVKL